MKIMVAELFIMAFIMSIIGGCVFQKLFFEGKIPILF